MNNYKMIKLVATTQAIVAPGLIVIGKLTKNDTLKNVGIIWSGLIAFDTARTTARAVDNVQLIDEVGIELNRVIDKERP